MDIHFESFMWDSVKESVNIQKHGIDFKLAAKVFADPNRKVFEDRGHGSDETRFYCIGKANDRIMTVRFVHRSGKIRIFGAGYWRKGRRYYEAS